MFSVKAREAADTIFQVFGMIHLRIKPTSVPCFAGKRSNPRSRSWCSPQKQSSFNFIDVIAIAICYDTPSNVTGRGFEFKLTAQEAIVLTYLANINALCHSRKRSNAFGDSRFWFQPNPIKFTQIL